MSGERIEKSINGKRRLQVRSITRRTQQNGESGFTNNKVLLSHFEPSKFNITLATQV